ncbi:MAG: serine/threonine protein kinase [Xanthomonadales bacterium]|nr:serine/threonine protein kinase [Xanthomonadales bacterium]
MDARALALFEQALTRPPPDREAFLRAQAGEGAVLDDALRLLRAHAVDDGLLEPSTSRELPAEIGGWRLLRRLGAGGMGEVHAVEREQAGFVQRGALKLLASGLHSPELVARFHAERRFLAQLEHPHIARVIDGGTAADGRPWVVMEHIDGLAIDQWCRQRALGVGARVRLFLQVLDAIDAAHRALILHRDIKPGNVLVDAQFQARLLDFGIAKSLADTGAALTATGSGPLTPQYASPEQLAGRALTIASDVYSAGLLLHELLTGRLPFDFGQRSLAEREALLRTAVPTRPSNALDGGALALAPRELPGWRRSLAGDLDRVLLKALAADVDRRYRSAGAFAEDLRRWLELRPVEARSGDAWYRARLFVRRNRLAVASASAALLALALGLAIAAQQARVASAQAARAEASSRFLMALITDANPVASGREPTLRQAIDQAVQRIPEHFVDQPDSEADVRLGIGLAYTSLMQLDEAQAQLERALALRAPGSAGHAEVLQAQALLEWTRGRTDAAERLYRAALAAYAADPGRQHDAGEVENDLAALMNDLGRFEAAIPLAESAVANARALALDAGVLGARLENLGSALQGVGRLDESEVAYRDAIAALEQALPQKTVALAVALNNFALVYRDRQRPQQALALFERAIALREQAFGADHGDLAGPLINAARLRAGLGQVERARADAARALALAEKAFAPDYVGRGHVHLGVAEVALAAGDAPAAARHAQAALDVFARADAADPAWSERAHALLRQAGAR